MALKKAVMFPDMEEIGIDEFSEAEELKGKLSSQLVDDKLMKSVLECDKKSVDEGKIVNEAINNGINSFTPDLMFKNITQNYNVAEKLYGERLISLLSGYDANYVKKNLKIPEFLRELQAAIGKNIEDMKSKDLLDKQGQLTDKGLSLASLVMYTQELDLLSPKGIRGEKKHKERSHYGERSEARTYKQGDRFKDLAVRKTLRMALKRGHTNITKSDLKTYNRQSKGQVYFMYAVDASGSMKGERIKLAKKAGISLSFKAIQNKDKVGLIVFGSEVKEAIEPTQDFIRLLRGVTNITASRQTDYVPMIQKAIELFPKDSDVTRHLLVLTDAMPTVGEDPEKKALEAVGIARSHGLSVSLVGINLDEAAKKFGKKFTQIGNGKFYLVKDLENLNQIILQDYYDIM